MPTKDLDNDLHLQNYQDGLDTSGTDVILHETTDEPQDTTGVPNKALKPELDKIALDELEHSDPHDPDKDDMRESIEDLDEGDLDKQNR